MKQTIGWIVLFLAAVALIAGCGGGGGGGLTGGGTGGAPLPGQYLEFVKGVSLVDPMNLIVGDTVQVQVVNYDGAGNKTVLAGSGFTITGPGAGSATINGFGQLTINTLPSGLIVCSANSVIGSTAITVTQDVFVPSSLNTTKVSGNLFSSDGATAMGYLEVQFKDSLGNLVGGARVNANGTFSGFVPTTATSLIVKPSTIPAAWYASLKYQGNHYAVVGVSCLLPLPGLTPGGNNFLPATVFVPRQIEGPPPPPSGC